MPEWVRRLAAPIAFCLLLGTVASRRCHGSTSCALGGRIIYNQVVAPSKETPRYYRELDLFYRDLPGGSAVRLTDFQHDPLLGPGISNPQWSPDGRRVLFLAECKTAPAPKKASWVRVFPWIVDVKTKRVESAGQRAGMWYLDAQWLPDGRSIVAQVVYGDNPEFAGGEGVVLVMSRGKPRLVVIDMKTRKERVVWQRSEPYFYLVSPQGDCVLLCDRWHDTQYLVSLRNGRYRAVCKIPDLGTATFSPDGKRIAVYSNSRLRVCNTDGSGMRLLYEGPHSGMHGSSLSWSPDGKWIALKHSSTDVTSVDPPVADTTSYIAVVNVFTGKARGFPDPKINAANDAGGLGIVGWSKDSKYLLFRKGRRADEPYPRDSRTDLTAYPLAGGAPVPVAEIVGYVYDLDWLPR